MQTAILVGLATLTLVGAGVVGASGVMAPATGMPAGAGGGSMGEGMMDGGSGMMGDGTCGCAGYAYCEQHMYDHNHIGDRGGMMP